MGSQLAAESKPTADEVRPLSQDVHVLELGWAEYFPASQLMQELCPVEDEYIPAAHSIHEVSKWLVAGW